ncbi:MAG TPA: CHAT domain-containing protein, partial [Anaerolineae bacterium]
MLYDDFDIIVADRQGEIYPVMAFGRGRERVTAALPAVPAGLLALLDRLAGRAWQTQTSSEAGEAGAALFRWLLPDRIETHFRLAWDRAGRAGRGLRLRLALDPPEIAGLPWELLADPVRDHTFATAANTLLVRFLDQAEDFGALAEPEVQMPLAMLLVLPWAPDLDLAREYRLVIEATAPLAGALNIHVLDGIVTRDRLAETLAATPYDIVHIGAHGGYVDGQGYLRLNLANGAADWIDAGALANLCGQTRGLKLMVLNACQSGRISREQAFRGLAPQLIRAGVPAVVAMQYVLTDTSALTFAREFYRQLCMGPRAGQVDVAVTHARSLLAALQPGVLA